jgi:hypothetical protein
LNRIHTFRPNVHGSFLAVERVGVAVAKQVAIDADSGLAYRYGIVFLATTGFNRGA